MLLKPEIRSMRKFFLIQSAAFLLGLAISSPTLAQAQSVFHFSKEVHWGDSVLPPGDYIISVSSDASPVVTVGQKSGRFVATIAPKTVSGKPLSGNLQVVTIDDGDGQNYVSTLYLRDSGAVLNFAAPSFRSPSSETQNITFQDAVPGDYASAEGTLFTIRNRRNQPVPFAEAQAIYLSACGVVEQEFRLSHPIRPGLTLVLGTDIEGLYYPKREIQLKKWDKYEFAQGVVMMAVADLLPKDKKLSLAKLAVLEAESIVDVSEWKSGRSLSPAEPRN